MEGARGRGCFVAVCFPPSSGSFPLDIWRIVGLMTCVGFSVGDSASPPLDYILGINMFSHSKGSLKLGRLNLTHEK